jgi:predicted RNase H-like nuclease (RuvC/YqgF family)
MGGSMVTERTPQHKRVKRAEEGRDTWKIKACERREEIERLKLELARKDERLSVQAEKIKNLEKNITSSNKTIEKQDQEIENLKKKL